jgi:hypothetical protein
MLVLNKQIVLSVDTPLDRPEMRRVSFYTEKGNVFYLELAIDRTEFIRVNDFDSSEITDPDALLDQERDAVRSATSGASATDADADELLKSLGM